MKDMTRASLIYDVCLLKAYSLYSGQWADAMHLYGSQMPPPPSPPESPAALQVAWESQRLRE